MKLLSIPLALLLGAAPSYAEPTGTPPPAVAAKRSAPTLAELIRQFPGKWSGTQRVISPAKTVMLVRVSEHYKIETVENRETLTGDIRYTIGEGASAKTFRGTSRTWIDAQGRGHAEVTQNGKTEAFDAFAREDSLVFLPVGHKGDPSGGTGVSVVTEKGTRAMIVRGFQRTPQGTFIIEGRLAEEPATPAP